MREYQGFAISNFRTGFNESVEPWLVPRDAFQQFVNCHLYRGVVERVDGYNLYSKMSYRKQLVLAPAPNGVVTTFTGTLSPLPTSSNFFGYATLVAGSTAQTVTYASDFSSNVITLSGSGGSTGTVNLTTGAVSITFGTAPPLSAYSTVFISWDSAPTVKTAIMGIQQYFDSAGGQEVMVFDQRRVGIIQSNFGILAQNNARTVVTEIPHDYYQPAVFTGDGVTVTFSGTLTASNIAPTTITFVQYTSTGVPVADGVIRDNGAGALVGSNVASGSINYTSGAYTITFTVAPANGNVFDSTAGIYGNLFTGSISNFFTLSNYLYNAFFTNSVDPIFYYDGFSVKYLNTNLDVRLRTATAGVPARDITRCLHLFVYRQRLVLMSPTVLGKLLVASVYWSVGQDPFDFSNDERENASTSEPIRSFGYINTDLIIRFSNSERILRYTGDENAPFKFDSTNNIWACDAPYSSINYDSWFSTVGKPAIVGSDGVNVKRVDEMIPDFTTPSRIIDDTPVPWMNQNSIRQGYGERFDDIKEGWLCYNSDRFNQTEVQASNNVLAFNYLDSTYAVYQFPLSCTGYGTLENFNTWGNTHINWEDMQVTWDSYAIQNSALINLGGDQYDNVYQLNVGNTLTLAKDNTTTPYPVLMSAITKNFNPFIEDGQLCRFGYMDVLVTADIDSVLRVQFYVNDQLAVAPDGSPTGSYQETVLRFTPTDNMSPNTLQTKVWKRIYVGAIGKEHTIRFYQNINDFGTTNDQPIYLHSMVLYMKPAGMLFN